MNNAITLNDLCNEITQDYEIQGHIKEIYVDNIANPYHANQNSLVFINSSRSDKYLLLEQTQARVIICDPSLDISLKTNKCFILVDNPKLVFALLSKIFFEKKPTFGIHPTATIHPGAKLAETVYIGPNTYVGECEIKSNAIIYGHTYLYDNVIVGENVRIQAGCVIGADGCGHIKNAEGLYISFPHVGKVIIESNVEIGTNTCIAKGALSDTIIREGTIIDSFVQIGHNVVIGKNVLILAHCVIGGSSMINDHAFLAIGAQICDYVRVGNDAHVGPGVVVISDVSSGAKVMPRAPLVLAQ